MVPYTSNELNRKVYAGIQSPLKEDRPLGCLSALTSSENQDSNHDGGLLHHNFSRQVSNILVPATLVGGSACIYTTVAQSPGNSITPLSLSYMLLLAIQYCIQPRATHKYLDKRASKQTAAFVEEVVKSSLAATLLCTTAYHKENNNAMSSLFPVAKVFNEWTLSSSLIVAGMPAILYAVQGVLTYSSQQHLDSFTFNGITQTKTLSAAFFCYILLKQKQSAIQLVALAGLLLSSFLFQGILPWKTREQKEWSPSDQQSFVKGVLPCIGATAISGLAGALSQKGLQIAGTGGRDPYLYTLEVSFYSAVCLLTSMLIRNLTCPRETKENDWFCYWKGSTLWPVVLKAFGGVLTVLVHKHSGSVAKGFSLMFGLVLSGILRTVLDGRDMENYHVLGSLLVVLSAWAHLSHPPI